MHSVWRCEPCKSGNHSMCLSKDFQGKTCICKFVNHKIETIKR